MDLQGYREVPRGRQGGRWSACGPTVLPTYRRRRTSLQPDWGWTCWHYPQEACRGWHLSRWWHWLHLHLLRTRRGQVQDSDRQLLVEGPSIRHACTWLGRGTTTFVVDH